MFVTVEMNEYAIEIRDTLNSYDYKTPISALMDLLASLSY
jgi:hypothetical protein